VKPYYEQDGITIYHGDTLELLRILPGYTAIVTDPPYGIALENHGMQGSHGWTTVAGDADIRAGVAVCEMAARVRVPMIAFASPWKPWPGYWPNLLVWDKGGAVGGGGDTATTAKRTWELIQARNVACRNGRPESVWRYPLTQNMLALHPTQKPEALMLRLIREFVEPEHQVFDPFMGSGTTLVAAKRLGRKAVGVEIEERYCEIAAKRLAQGALDFFSEASGQ
jgi:site-specific DNA-methyltransferase (adenine-specific)